MSVTEQNSAEIHNAEDGNDQGGVKNYFKTIIEHRVKIVSICGVLIPILGLYAQLVYYVYQKKFYQHFGVDDLWINSDFQKKIFNMIYDGIIGVLVISPNLINSLPFINEKETKKKIKSLLKSSGITFVIYSLLFLLLIGSGTVKLPFSIVQHVVLFVMAWIFICGFPLIIGVLNYSIMVLITFFPHPIKSIKGIFKLVRIHKIHIISLAADAYDKMNDYQNRKIINENSIQRAKNGNIALVIFLITGLIQVGSFIFFSKETGLEQAMKLKSFKTVVYEENNQKFPINAKIILAENDDNYLVAKAYIDESTNTVCIYKTHQTVIEKTDVEYVIREFAQPPELK